MASKHKHRPTLAAIPIPPNNAPSTKFVSTYTAVSKNGATPMGVGRSASSTARPPEELSQIDPDDLFARFTISEIRTIQAGLRADADAKQEELRLMVGERYRDLLQASTSIISIANSSKRVMGALTEMGESMTPDEPQRKPRSSSVRSKDDAHLKTLQSLSAHLKLLLDAPEHLWRLLEKKQHLQAAWLFLLARVVHRALVTDDSEDGGWESEGISVLTQFPLVQRQWDTVAQFRPQIAHRATQYLREHSISSENACSTVLTLHLLDSLPLTETLSTLLSQRSRTLNAFFARNLDFRSPSRPGSPIFKSRRKNREVAGMLLSPPSPLVPLRSRSRSDVVKDVREAMMELLDVITGTMSIVKDIFRTDGGDGSGMSLAERSLEDIQSDTPSGSMLTTPSLLSTLPSSTHLLTLPPSILTYKPYIDLTSPSAHVDSSVLDAKLSDWFDKAMHGFEGRMHAWSAGLDSIREVWSVRRKVLGRLLETQKVEPREMSRVRSVLDGGIKGRAGELVRIALDDLEARLDSDVRRAVGDVRDGVEESHLDTTPSAFLFSPPPIPSFSQASTDPVHAVSSFKRFKDALRRRADGRTPLLDRILGNVESRARELGEDLDTMEEDDVDSRELRDQIMRFYHPAAQASSTRIIQILQRFLEQEMASLEGDSDRSIDVVLFVGRICHNMSSSIFVQSLRYPDETSQAFQKLLANLHDHSLGCWSSHFISKALAEYVSTPVYLKNLNAAAKITLPSQPSPQLINALLVLASSVQSLGLSSAELNPTRVTRKAMGDFKAAVAGKTETKETTGRQEQVQLLWDLSFLQRLPCSREDRPEPSAKTSDTLLAKLSALRSHLQSSAPPDQPLVQLDDHIDRTISQYLQRCQTLLAPLLGRTSPSAGALPNGNAPDRIPVTGVKPTAFLPFGTPKVDQDFKPAMEIVKPSARFGLLLVGNTAMR